MGYVYIFFFFFQAEDGIRDLTVTGVQTCALPISVGSRSSDNRGRRACGETLRLEPGESLADDAEIGEIARASCRERVQISVVAVSLKKKKKGKRHKRDVISSKQQTIYKRSTLWVR